MGYFLGIEVVWSRKLLESCLFTHPAPPFLSPAWRTAHLSCLFWYHGWFLAYQSWRLRKSFSKIWQ
jgi:hypothetical protein